MLDKYWYIGGIYDLDCVHPYLKRRYALRHRGFLIKTGSFRKCAEEHCSIVTNKQSKARQVGGHVIFTKVITKHTYIRKV